MTQSKSSDPAAPQIAAGGVLPRLLGPFDAVMIVVGGIIGSGIFLKIDKIDTAMGSYGFASIMAVWIVAGIVTLCGALALAELAAMLPQAGGPYVYLREAYGRLPAFLFGWSEFLINRTGSMAILAAAFAQYFAQLAGPPAGIAPQVWQAGAAVTAIAAVVV